MDEFSDDGLDALNESALQELEDQAIQFTQAQKLAQSQAAPTTQHNAFEYEFEDDDLDDTVVIDEHAQPPPRPPPQQALPIHQQQALQQARHGTGLAGTQSWNQHLPPPRPSYPARPQYPLTHRPTGPSQRYQPPPSTRPQQPPQQSQFARPPLPVSRPYPAPASQTRHGAGPQQQNEIIAALQARLSELESDLTAAKGEASILRSKYDKARVTHDAEVARLKKENLEQIAKQERIAEQARAAERTTATELQFARQDLREELGRVKSKRKDGPATPRKDRTWGLADGFDGVEVLSSPTKGQTLRRKDSGPSTLPPSERTPTKGKRKRPAVDSPTFALETDGGDAVFDDVHPNRVSTLTLSSLSLAPPSDYLRLFLDHAAMHGQPPTFDLFSRCTFPSDPKNSLAAIVLQKLPQMGNAGEPLRLLIDFADMLIEMWRQCLSERYYAPIYHIVALILYTLELNTVEVAPHIISSLVPVCATTCRLVALPRLNSVDGDLSEHPDAVVRQLCLNIDVTQCLCLLSLTALGCLPRLSEEPGTPNSQLEFWRTMEFDFVLMMLSPKHPEADWLAMMSLLRTSVATDSIGPIPSSATDSSSGRAEVRSLGAISATLIDCVSSFLCDPPRWATSRFVKDVVARSAALGTLTTLATSPFGALQIAESDVAIPRLVTILCWAIDKLYDSDLPRKTTKEEGLVRSLPARSDEMDMGTQDENSAEAMDVDRAGCEEAAAEAPEEVLDPEPDPAELLCHIISQGTWLLHFLITNPQTSDVANTSTKLAASYGGSQRYFLALARLNFAEEDLVLEAGIDAETVELAHELLELAVTPDEGEEISEMFD
ncbi:hypothetical protein NEMBOFW57_007926 [Staphylotrichum longicolle]|uniref:DNA repair protein Rad26 n=1 Tax=Staphylotrichum longicolle TaxID=669026 RepID=A0AAD4HVI3_9PEZI|nr:hypothetical protein NEMBOFW57_007926 [Staphylotrichum longicolle]